MEKKVDSIIRIALVGPESTGKTTLTKELANYYNNADVLILTSAFEGLPIVVITSEIVFRK